MDIIMSSSGRHGIGHPATKSHFETNYPEMVNREVNLVENLVKNTKNGEGKTEGHCKN